jgi:hypothetical protein
MQHNLTLAISGHGNCGKDTVCEWLAKNTSLRYTGSTSRHAVQEVFDHMKTIGIEYADIEECYRDRSAHRQIWADVLSEINAHDKTTLYRRCLKDQDILNGVRNKDELMACKAAGMIDLIIWIDRDVSNDPTQGYGSELCDLIISNRHDLAALFSRLERLSTCLGIMKV